jgi:hypothetical protein
MQNDKLKFKIIYIVIPEAKGYPGSRGEQKELFSICLVLFQGNYGLILDFRQVSFSGITRLISRHYFFHILNIYFANFF